MSRREISWARGVAFALAWAVVLPVLVLNGGSALAQTPAEEVRAFDSAARAFQDGIFPRAEREFAEFVRAFSGSPRVPEAILYQARAALRQRRAQVSLELLTGRTNEAGPWADQFKYWLAETHLQMSNYQAAADAFGEVIRAFPQSAQLLEASYGEARARFKLGQWDRVIDLLRNPQGSFQTHARNRPNDPLVVRGRLLLAEACFEKGDYGETGAVLGRLDHTELTPEYLWQRQYLRARLHAAEQRFQEALRSSTNLLVVAAGTGDPDLLAHSIALHGRVLEQLNLLPEAIQAYTNNLAASAPPEHRRESLLKIIELTLALNRFDDALQQIEGFFAQYPQDVASDVALLTLAEMQLKQHSLAQTNVPPPTAAGTNHLELALGYLDKLLTNFPQTPWLGQAQFTRGWCLWEQGKVTDSGLAFKAALANLPFSKEQAVARFKWGDTELLSRNYTNALQSYRAILSNYQSLPAVREQLFDQAIYQIVRVSISLNDLDGASSALKQILSGFPASLYAQRSLLLVGQRYLGVARPADARAILEAFQKQFPGSSLLPQVELAVAQSYVEEGNWAAATRQYERHLRQFPTNELRPSAEFGRAWVQSLAGQGSNALVLFRNFLSEFPGHPVLAPRAQYWVANYYFSSKDFTNAEIQFQRLFTTNWPASTLTYSARMMAGRAAIARESYAMAESYFKDLVNDKDCPDDLVAEGLFALGDTITLDTVRAGQKYTEAVVAFSKLLQLYPTNSLVPAAWGRIGDCYLQLAVSGATYYDKAIEAYATVLSPTNRAVLGIRCQAEMGWALALERQAQLKPTPDNLAIVNAALDHYLNIFHGKNLRDGEVAQAFWLEKAGLSAARLLEEQRQWDVAINVYNRLMTVAPALRPVLEKKIDKAHAQVRSDKT